MIRPITPIYGQGQSLPSLQVNTVNHSKTPSKVLFQGDSGSDLFGHVQQLAQHAPQIFEKFNSHFTTLNNTTDSLDSLSMIWNGMTFAYKGFFRGRKLLGFLLKGKKDKDKKKEASVHPKIDELISQGKVSQALLLENFKEVNQALTGLQKQLQVMGDSTLSAAHDHITSAKEALESAHEQKNEQIKQQQFSLFQQQLVHAQHHLGLAKTTGSTLDRRIMASLTYGECALMLGQPKSAISQVDQAIVLMGGVPDVNMYYSLGQIAENKHQPKQATFFYNLGLFKANLEDASQHNGAHLSSAEGYRLLAGANHTLKELPMAEELAYCAVDIQESHLAPHSGALVKSYTTLGDILSTQGRPSEALPYLEKALTIRKIKSDGTDTDTKALVQKVSKALSASGQVGSSRSVF